MAGILPDVANPNYIFTMTVARGLQRLGMTDAVITPGSRNTPLALAFATADGINNWIHHDERSAGFFALGLAKTTDRPVALVCTSGTAAAEYFPAVNEAIRARVPLVVLTADRPAELRDVAAPQAIDQIGMYGRAVKWFHEAGTPTVDYDPGPYAARLAASAWTRSLEAPAGPVHINCPFREPLAPVDLPNADALSSTEPTYLGTVTPSADAIDAVAARITERRTLIVAGELPQASGPAIIDLAAALDAPVFADPLSQLRAGRHDVGRVIATGDTLARAGLLTGRLAPEVVLRFGAPATSKALAQYLAASPVPQIVVDDAQWREPTAGQASMLRGDAAATATALAKVTGRVESAWMAQWQEADRIVRNLWSEIEPLSEPGIVQTLSTHLPDNARLWVGNSMPIRDVDSFFGTQNRHIEIRANRGANGIDGFLSTVFGSAAASTAPTYGLCGDLSMLHDLTALAGAVRLGLDATILLVNNDGGGIFHFLPQADHPEFFESHLATPHGLGFEPLVGAFGAEHQSIDDQDQLSEALQNHPSGVRVVEIKTDRTHNAATHRDWWSKASLALA